MSFLDARDFLLRHRDDYDTDEFWEEDVMETNLARDA